MTICATSYRLMNRSQNTSRRCPGSKNSAMPSTLSIRTATVRCRDTSRDDQPRQEADGLDAMIREADTNGDGKVNYEGQCVIIII